jgi:hypothetical protein
MKMKERIALNVRRWARIAGICIVAASTASSFAQTKTNRPPRNIHLLTIVKDATRCDGFETRFKEQNSTLGGCIRGADPSAGPTDLWFTDLDTGKVSNTGINKVGEFLFADVPGGNYLLQVRQHGRLLAVKPIWVPGGVRTLPVLIDLSRGPDAFLLYQY